MASTLDEITEEAKLLYSQLRPTRRPWDKIKQESKKEKYLQIAAFTIEREKAHHHVNPEPQEAR